MCALISLVLIFGSIVSGDSNLAIASGLFAIASGLFGIGDEISSYADRRFR